MERAKVANWHRAKAAMFYHISKTGRLSAVWVRTHHDEMLLHCARIGFKP
jgi:hypothetical protein